MQKIRGDTGLQGFSRDYDPPIDRQSSHPDPQYPEPFCGQSELMLVYAGHHKINPHCNAPPLHLQGVQYENRIPDSESASQILLHLLGGDL